MLAVEISNLTKDYMVGFWRKRPRRALDRLSLEVEAGQVFGLLGPNGAGKTTTLKILMRLAFPTSGIVRILGLDPQELSLHGRIGYLPENPYFYDHLTAEEFLHYAARLCGLKESDRRHRVAGLLEAVRLEGASRLPLRKFSKGMTQRVGIAQALINDPQIIFMDEPMSGLDPLGRLEVRNLILKLKGQGKTIFFSTHILSDAETLCDRVAILDQGRLRGCGDVREIAGGDVYAVEFVVENPSPAALATLKSICGDPVRTGERFRFSISGESELEKALSFAVAEKVKLISVNPVRRSLEDYFVGQVGGDSAKAIPGAVPGAISGGEDS